MQDLQLTNQLSSQQPGQMHGNDKYLQFKRDNTIPPIASQRDGLISLEVSHRFFYLSLQ